MINIYRSTIVLVFMLAISPTIIKAQHRKAKKHNAMKKKSIPMLALIKPLQENRV